KGRRARSDEGIRPGCDRGRRSCSARRELVAQDAIPFEVDDRPPERPGTVLGSRVHAEGPLELGDVLRFVNVAMEAEEWLPFEDRLPEARAPHGDEDLLAPLLHAPLRIRGGVEFSG